MKSLIWLFTLSIIASILVGCEPSDLTVRATQAEQLSTSTVVPPGSFTRTATFTLPLTTTVPINTLEPGKTNEMVKMLLREPMDCSAPCFWGIMPGQTRADDARGVFSHLGLKTIVISHDIDFYNVIYELDSGLSIGVNLSVQNNLVETISVVITPAKQQSGSTREWSSYSPDTLIKRYGSPSRVEFVADWGPRSSFSMIIYFDSVDMIVEYTGYDVIPRQKGLSRVCPLISQFDSVRIWLGENPIYPPHDGISVEKATTLTIDEFSNLMKGDQNDACFIFNGDVFQ